MLGTGGEPVVIPLPNADLPLQVILIIIKIIIVEHYSHHHNHHHYQYMHSTIYILCRGGGEYIVRNRHLFICAVELLYAIISALHFIGSAVCGWSDYCRHSSLQGTSGKLGWREKKHYQVFECK